VQEERAVQVRKAVGQLEAFEELVDAKQLPQLEDLDLVCEIDRQSESSRRKTRSSSVRPGISQVAIHLRDVPLR
jgi:hypothetical protein